jgi:hypothetical protein
VFACGAGFLGIGNRAIHLNLVRVLTTCSPSTHRQEEQATLRENVATVCFRVNLPNEGCECDADALGAAKMVSKSNEVLEG